MLFFIFFLKKKFKKIEIKNKFGYNNFIKFKILRNKNTNKFNLNSFIKLKNKNTNIKFIFIIINILYYKKLYIIYIIFNLLYKYKNFLIF